MGHESLACCREGSHSRKHTLGIYSLRVRARWAALQQKKSAALGMLLSHSGSNWREYKTIRGAVSRNQCLWENGLVLNFIAILFAWPSASSVVHPRSGDRTEVSGWPLCPGVEEDRKSQSELRGVLADGASLSPSGSPFTQRWLHLHPAGPHRQQE